MLAFKAFRYHLAAHYSIPVNFWAGVLGIVVNNSMFLGGMWVALFSGRSENEALFPVFVAITACISGSWGLLLALFGGLRHAPRWNEEGALDPFLASPIRPLTLIAISYSALPAIGDILQAIVCLVLLAFVGGLANLAWTILVFPAVFIGLYSALVISASIPFFLKRGAAAGELFADSIFSASGYPLAQIIEGKDQWWIYITPLAITNLIPMKVIVSHEWAACGILYVGALGLLVGSTSLFRFGLTRYQSSNFVGILR